MDLLQSPQGVMFGKGILLLRVQRGDDLTVRFGNKGMRQHFERRAALKPAVLEEAALQGHVDEALLRGAFRGLREQTGPPAGVDAVGRAFRHRFGRIGRLGHGPVPPLRCRFDPPEGIVIDPAKAEPAGRRRTHMGDRAATLVAGRLLLGPQVDVMAAFPQHRDEVADEIVPPGAGRPAQALVEV